MKHKTTLFLLLLLAAFPWATLSRAEEPKPSVISRLFRRRAAVREVPMMVHKFAFLRLKPEDRLPDRVCIMLDDKVQYGGCVELTAGQVDVVVEFVGPVQFNEARMTSLYGESVMFRLRVDPADTLPNPF